MALLRTLILPVFLLAGAASAQAQDACPPAPPEPHELRLRELRDSARDRGVLWRLEKDGRTSWLYGTVHVNRLEWAVPGPRVLRAVEEVDVVALELDPADPELPGVFAARGDPAREQRVLAGLQDRIARLAGRACLPAERVAALRPMLQLMMLLMAESRREGLHAELGVDAVLWGLARGLRKDFVGLESPAEQIAAMVPESEEDERVLLERGLADLESGDSSAVGSRVMQAWAAGDEVQIASYPQWCKCLQTPAEQRSFQRLNDQRNVAMAGQLADMHAQGRRFFAGIGALHMTGPQALQTLLRERGFSVQRVPFPAPGTP
jgi:uncharacterized protein YbaP (TraB family)